MSALQRQYVIHFPNHDSMMAAQSTELASMRFPIVSEESAFVGFEMPSGVDQGAFLDRINQMAAMYDATVCPDMQFALDAYDADNFFDLEIGPDDPNGPDLANVCEAVKADRVWKYTRGAGVTIAIVDTGVNGSRHEFPAARRVGECGDLRNPWSDDLGHGTMCAAIAAGRQHGQDRQSRNGIAPEASLIACKSKMTLAGITQIYQYLTQWLKDNPNARLVVSNSWGRKSGKPPTVPATDIAEVTFQQSLTRLVEAGAMVVYSAGNNHLFTGQVDTAKCEPESIWMHKTRGDVLVVATCDLDRNIWKYSSRGPGSKYPLNPSYRAKPDVTAPTPASGRVLFRDRVCTFPEGWGTSGACPQVAGLAALLWSAKPSLSNENLAKVIRDSSHTRSGTDHYYCWGKGLINCEEALNLL